MTLEKTECSRIARYELTISGGSMVGLRHQLAQRLREQARGHRVLFRINPEANLEGSKDVLDDIDEGRLDVGLVQGGLDPKSHPNVRRIAAFHNIEPLHLLTRRELVESVADNLAALTDKTINVGPVGSGTHDLAREVLKFAGLKPKAEDGSGDYTELRLSQGDLVNLAREKSDWRRPDAIFLVSGLRSRLVRLLVDRHQYELVPLEFCDAFALDALSRELSPGPASQPGPATDVWRTRFYPIKIPRFTYGMKPPMPANDLTTFGPRLLLVARERVENRAVCQILETVFSPTFAQFSNPPLDVHVLETSPEYPLHPATEAFLESSKPVLASDLLDRFEKVGSLGAVILSASFFLWQWIRQYYRRKRDLGFESYMLKVAQIEDQALALEMEARLELKELLRLQRELGRLRNEVLARFAEGVLEVRDLISGFVSHVNEARNYLNRLILHERNKMEERALQERRSTESVWNEALEESSDQAPRPPKQDEHPGTPDDPSASAAV